jgi:hypothetical protein
MLPLISNSGAGDHGKDGLRTFIREHSCVGLCDKLGLTSIGVLKATLEHHTATESVADEDDEEVDDQVTQARMKKGKGRVARSIIASRYTTPDYTPAEGSSRLGVEGSPWNDRAYISTPPPPPGDLGVTSSSVSQGDSGSTS